MHPHSPKAPVLGSLPQSPGLKGWTDIWRYSEKDLTVCRARSRQRHPGYLSSESRVSRLGETSQQAHYRVEGALRSQKTGADRYWDGIRHWDSWRPRKEEMVGMGLGS